MQDTDQKIDQQLIAELRQMMKSGASVAELSIIVQQRLSLPSDSCFLPVVYFVKAFYLTIVEAKDLGLWCGFGGSYTDQQINEVMMPPILAKRSQWDV